MPEVLFEKLGELPYIETNQASRLNVLVELRLISRPVQRICLSSRGFDVPICVLDKTRIQEAFGWKPEVGMQEGLTRTLTWIRQSHA